MELASDSSGDHLGAIGYSSNGDLYCIQEEWANIGMDVATHPGMADNINEKEMIAHIAMIDLLVPAVGSGYAHINTKIDNTSAQSPVVVQQTLRIHQGQQRR